MNDETLLILIGLFLLAQSQRKSVSPAGSVPRKTTPAPAKPAGQDQMLKGTAGKCGTGDTTHEMLCRRAKEYGKVVKIGTDVAVDTAQKVMGLINLANKYQKDRQKQDRARANMEDKLELGNGVV